jgi:hypothetical protein
MRCPQPSTAGRVEAGERGLSVCECIGGEQINAAKTTPETKDGFHIERTSPLLSISSMGSIA